MIPRRVFWFLTTLALVTAGCAPKYTSHAKPDNPGDDAAPTDQPSLEVHPSPLPDGLRPRIEAAVQNVRERDLLTTNGFWTVFHGILGLGPNVQLVDPETRAKVNALDYICSGGKLRGLQFDSSDLVGNGLDVRTMVGSGIGQGHQDQFIAEMAQWGIAADRKFHVGGKDYTYMDFVRHTQMRASLTKNQELSWAIVIIGQYLGTDIAWTNGSGEKLHFHDLLRYELEAPINEQTTCGGTHRLFDLHWVYQLHLNQGGRTEGIWKQIAENNDHYRDMAKKYQNADGSFSTDFLIGPGTDPDKQRRINTTGHILEWLALSLSDDDLRTPWVQDAASALSLMILDLQSQPIEGGSLYHAVHGLLIYYARVYDPKTLGPPELVIPRMKKSMVGKK
jgi:hypothetical protein